MVLVVEMATNWRNTDMIDRIELKILVMQNWDADESAIVAKAEKMFGCKCRDAVRETICALMVVR
jgi:hypothetical protein